MKYPMLSTLAFSLALITPAFAADLTPAERAALAAQPCTEMVSMRAGASEAVPAVALAESIELTRAAAATPELDALRAGDLSNHDLTVGLVIVGVVILAILIF